MKTDSLGIPQFTETDLVNMIYKGHVDKCAQVLCEDSPEIHRFNQAAARFGRPELDIYSPLDVTQEEFDATLQSEWFMPDEYKTLNVDAFLNEQCSSTNELERVNLEMRDYHSRDMVNILRYMIYLVDFMRENKIVWGVGRGSSVASFVLYLIGIHRINSIQYDLDFHEFMR
jgi:DNA polymerase III alpha subunit